MWSVVSIPMQALSAKILGLHRVLRRPWNLPIFPEPCLLLEVGGSLHLQLHNESSWEA